MVCSLHIRWKHTFAAAGESFVSGFEYLICRYGCEIDVGVEYSMIPTCAD